MRRIIALSIIVLLAETGRYAKAEFIFDTPTNLGPIVNSTASDGSPRL